MKTNQRMTITDVADRMEQAAHTMKRLPKVKVRGYFGTWPPIMQEAVYAYGWEEVHIKKGPPNKSRNPSYHAHVPIPVTLPLGGPRFFVAG